MKPALSTHASWILTGIRCLHKGDVDLPVCSSAVQLLAR
jgi:hypothetical protein